MLQVAQHRHGDLIFLLPSQNGWMDSIAEHRRQMGARITRLREKRGLSQPALAEASGIKQPSLWAIEKGETKEVSARTLIGLCHALETTIEYVWGGSELPAEDAENEVELVAIYRRLGAQSKFALLQSARTLLQAEPPTRPTLSVHIGQPEVEEPFPEAHLRTKGSKNQSERQKGQRKA